MAQEQENNTDFQSTNTNVEQNASASICNEDELEFVELNIQVRDCRSNQTVNNARVHKLFIKDGGTDRIKQTFTRDLERKDTGDTAALVKSSMEVLKTLGFGTDTTIPNTNASYEANGAAWRKHYNDYWKEAVPDCDLSIESGRPSNEMMKYIVDHYNSHRATDANGILKIYIPKPLLEDEKTLTIEVGFHDFPIVLERVEGGNVSSILRNEEESAGTGFNVSWNGTQSTAWGGNFGWVVNNISGEEQQTSELKVSETITIKTDAQNNDFDDSVLSTFHDDTKHFVLFAMQWCQPVWDGIEDRGSANETIVVNNAPNVYIQDDNLMNLNMHIVTSWHGGSKKTYGTTRHQDINSWVVEAVDIHTEEGQTLEFAVHAGDVVLRHNSPSAGNYVTLSWGGANLQLRYLHMASFSVADGYIMCGTIVGTAGRTGNFPDRFPCHVHLDDGQTNPRNGIIVNRDTEIDEWNRICIPTYNYPMLFPCCCGIPSVNHNASRCNFSNTNIVTSCWAVNEMRCPYMWNSRNRRIQAQLRNLGLYNGSIDGSWGTGTRDAIQTFKRRNDLLVNIPEQDRDMNEEVDDPVLNEQVPINVIIPEV